MRAWIFFLLCLAGKALAAPVSNRSTSLFLRMDLHCFCPEEQHLQIISKQKFQSPNIWQSCHCGTLPVGKLQEMFTGWCPPKMLVFCMPHHLLKAQHLCQEIQSGNLWVPNPRASLSTKQWAECAFQLCCDVQGKFNLGYLSMFSSKAQDRLRPHSKPKWQKEL